MPSIGKLLSGVANLLTSAPNSNDNQALKTQLSHQALANPMAVPQDLADFLRKQMQLESLTPSVPIRGGLPDTQALTTDQKYDYYASVARSRNTMKETPVGHRTIIGFRVLTLTHADSTTRTAGRGVYDDRVVVIWKELDKKGNEVKQVREFTANTEPSAQYDGTLAGTRKENGLTIARAGSAYGNDADGDGRKDLGRLRDNSYIYERSSSRTMPGSLGDRILRPVTPGDSGLLVDRDVNHDGSFNDADRQLIADYKARLVAGGRTEKDAQRLIDRELNSGETIYFHKGGAVTKDRQGNITSQNTFSAGCQTFPGSEQFNEFWETLGEARVTGQQTFEYVLVTLSQ